MLATQNGTPYTPTNVPTISIWNVSSGSQVISSVNMTRVGTSYFYYYSFSSFVYGTNYTYLVTGDASLTPAERYKYGAVMQEVADRIIVTIQSDAGNTSTTFHTDRAEGTTDYWKNALCTFLTGTLAGQVQQITGYSGSTYFVTFTNGYTGAPSAGDICEFIVV